MMRKALLIIGVVGGSLVLLFGLLALLVGLTDTGPDRGDVIGGSIIFIGPGIAVLAPCLFFLIRTKPRTPLPAWTSPAPMATASGALPQALAEGRPPVPGLEKAYLEWFGWCSREIRGDALVLHAATMAALREAATGTAGTAAESAHMMARMTAGRSPAQPPRKLGRAKLRQLSRVAAATLPLLEPGEQVQVSVVGLNQRRVMLWQLFLGVVGHLIAASQQGVYYLTVTDRRLIALIGSQFGGRPKTLAFAIARSMVAEVRWRRRIPWLAGALRVRRLDGGWTVAAVPRSWKLEAETAYRLLAPGAGTPLPLKWG